MAICPNCNAQVDDGAKFCGSCGAQMPQEEITNTEPMPEEPVTDAVQEMPDLAQAASVAVDSAKDVAKSVKTAAKKIDKKHYKFGGIAVAVVLVIAIIASFVNAGKPKADWAFYIKSGKLFSSTVSGKKETQVARNFGSTFISLSADGKTVFYTNDDGDLYYRTVGNEKKDAVKVVSKTWDIKLSENSSVITYRKNGDLYQRKVKKDNSENKIHKNVDTFYASDDAKTLYYVVSGDDDLYMKRSGKDEVKIAGDIEDVETVSKDYKTVYYTKRNDGETGLWRSTNGKEPQKLVSDISNVLRIYDSGEVYYTTRDTDESTDTLWYYNGKDAKKVASADSISLGCSSGDKPVIVYCAQDGSDKEYYIAAKDKNEKISVGDADRFTMSTDGKILWYTEYTDDDHDEIALYQASVSGTKLKGVKKVDEGEISFYNLSGMSYFSSGSGDAYSIAQMLGGYNQTRKQFIYYKDDALYVLKGKKPVKIADDVWIHYVLPTGDILYLKNYEDGAGDLFRYHGAKSTKIGEKVQAIVPVYGKYAY